MPASDKSAPTPSPLLALLCLAIVHRLRPTWAAVTLSDAAATEQVGPQRLSRLCSGAIEPFEQVVGTLTRIGRPARNAGAERAEAELALVRELLGIATAVIARLPPRAEMVRMMLLGAFDRLLAEHPSLTAKRFCEALAIPARTWRSWCQRYRSSKRPETTSGAAGQSLQAVPQPNNSGVADEAAQAQGPPQQANQQPPAQQGDAPPQQAGQEPEQAASVGQGPTDDPPAARQQDDPAPKKPRQKRKRPKRRGRFGFDVTLPGTQQAADTTDLSAFGVPLKLIAAQDVGGRDANLFDAVIIDDTESAEQVAAVLVEALAGKQGIQVITDQGTPYLAKQTREVLDRLGAEHAIQREGDPLGKATIERAFRTIKDIAQPLLDLTSSAAEAIPLLADAELAKATATVLLTALLRAYQAGARATRRAIEARGSINADELAQAAERSRERARVHDNSARQLLSFIHEAYSLTGRRDKFIRRFRRFPLPVLRDAERAFGSQVHRDNIRDRTSYFAAIVRSYNGDYQRLQAQRRADQAANAKLANDEQLHRQQQQRRLADPASWLNDALNMVALQWQPHVGKLLFHGEGVGLGWIRAALKRLVQLHGPTAAADVYTATMQAFANAHVGHLGPDGLCAIKTLLQREVASLTHSNDTFDCTSRFASTTLLNHRAITASGPPPPLRN